MTKRINIYKSIKKLTSSKRFFVKRKKIKKENNFTHKYHHPGYVYLYQVDLLSSGEYICKIGYTSNGNRDIESELRKKYPDVEVELIFQIVANKNLEQDWLLASKKYIKKLEKQFENTYFKEYRDCDPETLIKILKTKVDIGNYEHTFFL